MNINWDGFGKKIEGINVRNIVKLECIEYEEVILEVNERKV